MGSDVPGARPPASRAFSDAFLVAAAPRAKQNDHRESDQDRDARPGRGRRRPGGRGIGAHECWPML